MNKESQPGLYWSPCGNMVRYLRMIHELDHLKEKEITRTSKKVD
jgi:hypothetical protein